MSGLALPRSIIIVEGVPSPFSRALIAGRVFRSPIEWVVGFDLEHQALAEEGGAFLIEGFATKAPRAGKRDNV